MASKERTRPKSAIIRIKPKSKMIGNTFAAGNHNSGAPLKYDDAFIEQEAIALREWVNKPDSLFMIDFTLPRNYGRQRIAEFVRSNKVFADVYEFWLEIQEKRLLQLGLTKQHDSQLTKFALINKHKWHDSTQVNAVVEQKPYVKDDM